MVFPSSSTRHQFDKFKELLLVVEKLPSLVIVSFFYNDIYEDYTYPYATVVDGWLVNSAFLNQEGKRTEVTQNWLRKMTKSRLLRNSKKATCKDSFWVFIKCYSLSINVLNSVRHYFATTDDSFEDSENGLEYEGEILYPSHSLLSIYADGEKLKYSDELGFRTEQTGYQGLGTAC